MRASGSHTNCSSDTERSGGGSNHRWSHLPVGEAAGLRGTTVERGASGRRTTAFPIMRKYCKAFKCEQNYIYFLTNILLPNIVRISICIAKQWFARAVKKEAFFPPTWHHYNTVLFLVMCHSLLHGFYFSTLLPIQSMSNPNKGRHLNTSMLRTLTVDCWGIILSWI